MRMNVLKGKRRVYENRKKETYTTNSTTFSSFDNIQPYVNSAAFAFPYPVSCMGVTTTKNGISTKAIICK